MRDVLQELKRRNVFRVGIAYVALAWVIAQVAELALDSFDAPAWVMKTILLLLPLGFPLALFFAWVFELTPEGLKREKDVDRGQSITRQTGRKLDLLIIGVLLIAVGFLLVDKFVFSPEPSDAATVIAQQESRTARSVGQSIAVIPFVDMSPTGDQEYFTDGLTENLLHALAQIGDIKVAGRTSSFAFKGRNEDLRSIGAQLNVQNILEGSVQKAGNQIRITAQLVNTNDGFHLWSETFDRNLNDIFAVQDEISQQLSSRHCAREFLEKKRFPKATQEISKHTMRIFAEGLSIARILLKVLKKRMSITGSPLRLIRIWHWPGQVYLSPSATKQAIQPVSRKALSRPVRPH